MRYNESMTPLDYAAKMIEQHWLPMLEVVRLAVVARPRLTLVRTVVVVRKILEGFGVRVRWNRRKLGLTVLGMKLQVSLTLGASRKKVCAVA